MKQSLARRTPRRFPALLAVGLLTAATPTFAQPGMGGPNGGPGGQNGNRGGGNRPDRAQIQAQMIARSLQSAGFNDEVLTEAVTTYMTNQTAARKPLYDAANALSGALTDPDTTDAQMATLWSDFNKVLDAEKARTARAETELDAQVGYSKDPKLAAALTLLGVTGDAMNYLSSGQGGRGPGGRGGPGGQNGGPGGRGGPGGGNN